MILAWFLLSLSSVYILLGILYNDLHSNTDFFFSFAHFASTEISDVREIVSVYLENVTIK